MFLRDSPPIKKLKEIKLLAMDLFGELNALTLQFHNEKPKSFLKKHKIKDPNALLTQEQFQDLMKSKTIQFIRWRKDVKPKIVELLPKHIEELNHFSYDRSGLDNVFYMFDNLRHYSLMLKNTLELSGNYYLNTLKNESWIIPTPNNNYAASSFLTDMDRYIRELFSESDNAIQRLRGKKNPKTKKIKEATEQQKEEIKKIRYIKLLRKHLLVCSNELGQHQDEFKTLLFPVIRIIRKARLDTTSGRSTLSAAVLSLRQKLKLILDLLETIEDETKNLQRLKNDELYDDIVSHSVAAYQDGTEIRDSLQEIYGQLNDQTYIKTPSVVDKDKQYMVDSSQQILVFFPGFSENVDETRGYVEYTFEGN